MFQLIKFFIILAIIAMGVFLIYEGWVGRPVGGKGDNVIFTVRPGESVEHIAHNLLEADLIRSVFYFKVYVWRRNLGTKLQAGEYSLSPSMSIGEIVDKLALGRSLSREKEIKILEGWRIDDINEYFLKNNIIHGDSFIELAKKKIGDWKLLVRQGGGEIGDFNFWNDAPSGADLEGFLFPDTYRIYNDAAARDIVIKMLYNFGKKLNIQMRRDIAARGKTIYAIVTMASLIEREVRTEGDMKIVSGIFWDRIKNGQPLESCATLAYVLGVNKRQYSLADTRINSPYNTYQHPGLPPGPICNPGMKAIRAAIYPEYTEYNYFLNRPDTGKTVFSKTYEEHLKNKNKYLK